MHFSKTNENCPIQIDEKTVKQLTGVPNFIMPIIDFQLILLNSYYIISNFTTFAYIKVCDII